MAITAPEKNLNEIIPNGIGEGADTAVSGDGDAAPVTAPEGTGTAAPDIDPAPVGDARVEAVWAALNAEPGTSATLIGAAAGLSRVVTGKILNQLESEGRARREQGTNDGQGRGRAADRWYPIPGDAITTPDAEDADVPESVPAGLDAAPEGDAVSVGVEDTQVDAIDSADHTLLEEPTDEVPGQPENPAGDETPEEDLDGDPGEPDSSSDADASDPAADDPEWARVKAELAELTDLLGGIALAKDEGNAVMALGCLEMAMAKVATVHRNARAVLTGTAAPARPASATRPGSATGGTGGGVRPGSLRDRVHAHLIAFPDKDFTPYEIGKVLDASSGAVANALDRLVNLGDAVLTCERPRRFALAPTANSAAQGAPAEGSAGADAYDG